MEPSVSIFSIRSANPARFSRAGRSSTKAARISRTAPIDGIGSASPNQHRLHAACQASVHSFLEAATFSTSRSRRCSSRWRAASAVRRFSSSPSRSIAPCAVSRSPSKLASASTAMPLATRAAVSLSCATLASESACSLSCCAERRFARTSRAEARRDSQASSCGKVIVTGSDREAAPSAAAISSATRCKTAAAASRRPTARPRACSATTNARLASCSFTRSVVCPSRVVVTMSS